MKRILLILFLFVSTIGTSQVSGDFYWPLLLRPITTPPPPPPPTTPFSFTEYAYSNPDLINPGRGAEQWHNGSEAINVLTASTTAPSLDVYYRFEWARVEGATQGSYVFGTYTIRPTPPFDTIWNDFDDLLQDAARNGQQFSFGIMTFWTDGGFVSYGGATSSYPQYVHNLMQASANPADRDVIAPSGVWMPNWNHPSYLARLRALHTAMNNYLLTAKIYPTSGPHAGKEVRARDIIYCIDIRGFGDYGEWHTQGTYDFSGFPGSFGPFPGNTQPTEATLIEIIDTHTEVFQDWPLVMLIAGYMGTGGPTYVGGFHKYNNVGYYALKATNAWGKVGHRRDQFGADDGYLDQLLQGNNTVVSGERFGDLFVNLGRTSPGTGEPMPNQAHIRGMGELEQQVIDYKETSFGNGNWGNAQLPNATQQTLIRAAFKRSGYRIKITTGEAPTAIIRGTTIQIKTNWQNIGVCPAYNNWVVQFELQNTSTSAVVWTGTSSKVLKLFRPDQGIVLTTDNLLVPVSVPTGTYKLVVRVRDAVNYRPNMKLAITQAQNADGSYTIFNNVVVTAT